MSQLKNKNKNKKSVDCLRKASTALYTRKKKYDRDSEKSSEYFLNSFVKNLNLNSTAFSTAFAEVLM